MYIHLGQDTIISCKEIIGIFNLYTSSISKITKHYLSHVQMLGEVMNVSMKLPKSFVVCKNKDGNKKVYISQISSKTLLKRSKTI